ncbi:MAG: hypothetical protein AAB702_00980 [Patescibacteria group bacterium]
MNDNPPTFKCPLCESIVTREKWIMITGQWDERQKLINESKELQKKYTQDKKQFEADKKRFELEKRRAEKAGEAKGVLKGIQKEKSERIKMTALLEKRAKDITASHETIKKLQEQLKKGVTPQSAGFDYEKEVQRMLSEAFPEDNIQSTGKMGDVLQHVMSGKDTIGKILYECKKTDIYKNEFINEIIRHQESAHANYAVIVTHAQKKDKSKFFLEGEVIIIDPLGLLDLAYLLRTTLIEMNKMKLTKEEAKQKGIEVLRYMQAGDFKAYMVGNIEQTKKAYDLLIKEIGNHKKDWEERLGIYYTIHQNTQKVRGAIGEILTGKQLGESELGSFPVLENQDIPLLETEKVIKKNEKNQELDEQESLI